MSASSGIRKGIERWVRNTTAVSIAALESGKELKELRRLWHQSPILQQLTGIRKGIESGKWWGILVNWFSELWNPERN